MPTRHYPKISERATRLLKALVERYIQDGQPVGSKTLAEGITMTISPATIRNIMAELEATGFIFSPHHSAGRIPTEKGYRLFVDGLMTVQTLDTPITPEIEAQLIQNSDPKNIVTSASTLLSSITQLVGVVTIPKQKQLILKHVEFLPLSANRVLVVLVLNKENVQNRIIQTDRHYSQNELQQAANYLTSRFKNQDLNKIKKELLAQIHSERNKIEEIAKTIIAAADNVFPQDAANEQCVVVGETNLLSMIDETGIERLRALYKTFREKRDILHLLDKCLTAKGIQIYIGEESGCETLNDCSLISAPYKKDGKIVGVLGVIGPTRMNYHRAISAVDITAKLLSAALTA